MKLVAIPDELLVYDFGPNYYDRLTVIYPDGAAFTTTLNEEPYFHYEGQFHEISVADGKRLRLLPPYVLARIEGMI